MVAELQRQYFAAIRLGPTSRPKKETSRKREVVERLGRDAGRKVSRLPTTSFGDPIAAIRQLAAATDFSEQVRIELKDNEGIHLSMILTAINNNETTLTG